MLVFTAETSCAVLLSRFKLILANAAHVKAALGKLGLVDRTNPITTECRRHFREVFWSKRVIVLKE